MSVLIKGMEMPISCGKCPMMRPGNYKGHAFPCTCHAKGCFPIKPDELDLRDGLCPLVKVPTPHGRLIDADAILKEMDKQENAMYEHGCEFSFSFKSGGDVCTAWYNVEMMVDYAPTIIEADMDVMYYPQVDGITPTVIKGETEDGE